MGFGKFFEKLGIIEDVPQGTQPSVEAKAPVAGTTVNVIPKTEFPVPPPITVAVEEPVEQKYLDHFMQFLEKNNIPGLDYWEFATTLHNMYEKFGTTVTEGQLYDMAFTLFQAQGITAQALVDTAQKYLDLVEQHRKEFEAHLSNEGGKTIQDKKNENTKLEQSIAAADNQIAALQQQIVNLQTKKATEVTTLEANKQVIIAEEQKNKSNYNKFLSALKVVVDKVNSDIAKIKMHLK